MVPIAPLHEAPAGLLVMDAVFVAPDTILSATVDAVEVPLQLGSGEALPKQGSTPCNFTITVGEPVAVVKVQLPEPGVFGMFRLALIDAVV